VIVVAGTERDVGAGLGFLETATPKSLPERDTHPAKRTSIDSVYGKVSSLLRLSPSVI